MDETPSSPSTRSTPAALCFTIESPSPSLPPRTTATRMAGQRCRCPLSLALSAPGSQGWGAPGSGTRLARRSEKQRQLRLWTQGTRRTVCTPLPLPFPSPLSLIPQSLTDIILEARLPYHDSRAMTSSP